VALLVPISTGEALTQLAAEGLLTRASGDLLALGRLPRIPAGKAPALRKLARARAHER
jgi:hypothetical protein